MPVLFYWLSIQFSLLVQNFLFRRFDVLNLVILTKKSNKIKVVLEYNKEDICTIWRYEKFLIKNLEKGNKIPARVLNKFFSLLTVEKDRLKHELQHQVDDIKALTIKRYCNDKDYAFDLQLPSSTWMTSIFVHNHKGKVLKSYCNLTGLIEYVFTGITDYFFENREKRKFIELVNSRICEYFKMFKCDEFEIFSSYKRQALAGYITYKFGFQLSKEIMKLEEDELSNEMLKESTKHYIPTPKKKKRK